MLVRDVAKRLLYDFEVGLPAEDLAALREIGFDELALDKPPSVSKAQTSGETLPEGAASRLYYRLAACALVLILAAALAALSWAFLGPRTWRRVGAALADPKALMRAVRSTLATLWAETMAMYSVWFFLGISYQAGFVL